MGRELELELELESELEPRLEREREPERKQELPSGYLQLPETSAYDLSR